jgi:glycosyltransferase involved in cell wall biosynthesis
MQPFFSVVIPVYNAEDFIKDCIQSILQQDFKDFEILLINDGSIDQSLNICREYKTLHSNVKVYTQENKGVSVARNLGIQNASGKYVTFVDSDDFVGTSFLSNFYAIVAKQEFDLVISGYTLYHKDKEVKVNDVNSEKLSTSKNLIAEQIVFAEISTLLSGPFAKIFKNDILKNNKVLFDKKFQFGEDAIFNLTFLQHVESLYIINSKDYYYVQSDRDSLVKRRYSFEKTNDYINTLTNLRLQTIKKFNIIDHRYFNFLKKEETLYKIVALQSIYLSQFKKKRHDRYAVIKQEVGNLNLSLLPKTSIYYRFLWFVFSFKKSILIDVLLSIYIKTQRI